MKTSENEETIASLAWALANARRAERETDRAHYVVQWHDGRFSVTDRMPIIGVWFDSDGIKHG